MVHAVMEASPGSIVGTHGQEALCCFCGLSTWDGANGDGLRMNLIRGPETRMVAWAHVTCLSDRMMPEFRDYLSDALEAL